MARTEIPEHHPAFEEYCEAIYELGEDDVEVIQARLAERLKISRPAVSEMVRRLERDGLVTVDSGHIDLTDDGKELAESVVRRHRLAERFLTDALGLSSAEAHAEAGRWEHVISDRVEAAMVEFLGNPTTCPHGNPIPGSTYEAPAVTPLVEVAEGDEFTVVRIPEELEFAPGILDYLDRNALGTGAHGRVAAAAPDGTMTVAVGDRHIGVGAFVAERLLVSLD